MKTSVCMSLVISSLLAGAAVAGDNKAGRKVASYGFLCKSREGEKINVTFIGKDGVRLEGNREIVGDGTGTLDRSYKPRPQHAGSVRYRASNDCGGYDIIFDAAMASGKSGRMTIEQDCDSDGSGPTFTSYSCEK